MTCLLTAMRSAKHILCISIYKEFDKNKLKNKQNPWKYDSILISFARLSVKNPKLRNLPWITSVCKSGKSNPRWPDTRSVGLLTMEVNM